MSAIEPRVLANSSTAKSYDVVTDDADTLRVSRMHDTPLFYGGGQ
jgi:hypothetical protein